ncbi:hypothetical protein D1007_29961 [Hordeum vulgare]|nr:hypothetical protein D1007_29961 [Hordeum vulgare]
MVNLDYINIWVQIHDVRDLYAHSVPTLATKAGEVLFTEPLTQDFAGNFYRVWVRINVHKPLKNTVSMIRDSKRQIYRVRYEHLPYWCDVCGHLGNVYKGHGDGVHPALLYTSRISAQARRLGQGQAQEEGADVAEGVAVAAVARPAKHMFQ